MIRSLPAALLLGWSAVASAAAGVDAQDLERRSKAFYEAIERGDKARAQAEFPGLERELDQAEDRLRTQLADLRESVLEHDGDLDDLMQSPQWREPEVASLVIAYHLAWVRYQGAQLTSDDRKKKSLLRSAAEGFSQFVEMSSVQDIAAESLYGRGLARLELGEYGDARADLEAATKKPHVAEKARQALAELGRRQSGGKTSDGEGPPQPSPEEQLAQMVEKLRGLLKTAARGDAAAEKDATALARGLAARGKEWTTRVPQVVAETLGGDAAESVRSSYGLFLLAQLAVDAQKCGDVAPLSAASERLTDAGRSKWRPEILFIDAGCRLNAGKTREGVDLFGTLVKEFPDSPKAREAAYFRLRALDTLRITEPAQVPAYEEALRGYLQRFEKTDAAPEVHWRLGELYRVEEQWLKAIAEFDQVKTGPYATRARLGALESRVGDVTARKSAPPEERKAVVDAIRTFVREAQPKGDDERPVAEAALLGALVASKGPPSDDAAVVDLLRDYESRFPNVKDFHARAVELRLRSTVALGKPADAVADVERFLAAGPIDGDRRSLLAQVGRDLMTQAERGGGGATHPALALSRKVFAALVEHGGTNAERLQLAEVQLRSGDAAAARATFESVLSTTPDSAEALRGAARSASTAGDPNAALGYWKRVVDGSTPGGTAWFEARVAQVELLGGLDRSQACSLARGTRGRSTTTGGDALSKRMQELERDVCR